MAKNIQLSTKLAPGLKLFDEKYYGIDIEVASTVLLQEQQSFYGHRQILFAGFCAWVISPTDKALRTPKDADEILPDHANHLREILLNIEKCDVVILAHLSSRKNALWEVHQALLSIQLELETQSCGW